MSELRILFKGKFCLFISNLARGQIGVFSVSCTQSHTAVGEMRALPASAVAPRGRGSSLPTPAHMAIQICVFDSELPAPLPHTLPTEHSFGVGPLCVSANQKNRPPASLLQRCVCEVGVRSAVHDVVITRLPCGDTFRLHDLSPHFMRGCCIAQGCQTRGRVRGCCHPLSAHIFLAVLRNSLVLL